MATTPDPVLYGPDNLPLRYGGPRSSGGRFLSASDNSGTNRPSSPIRNDNVNRLVPTLEHRVMVSLSERMVCNHDVIDGAMWSKAQFSFSGAWEPRFLGQAKDWGKLATDFLLNEFYQIGDLKGPMHDAQTNLEIDSVTLDRSGDFGILLGEFDGGYPNTQRISPWRIGQPGAAAADGLVSVLRIAKMPDGSPAADTGEIVEFKLAKPLRMEKGIIYGPSGRPLYYRVMVDEPGALTKSNDWQDVHFADFIHVYDPVFHDQGRGWPACYASLGKLLSSLTSTDWEQLAILMASSIGLIEHNETGTHQKDPSDPMRLTDPGTGVDLPFAAESFFGGAVRFFRANSGAKLEQFFNQRPGNPWRDFRDDINEGALRGMNWSPMLAWGRGNPGGQKARGEIMQCRVSVTDRQKVMFYPTRRRDGYAISKAIKIKRLPPYPGTDLGGQFMWGYRLPAKISIDDGRDADNRRKDLILGCRNLDDVLGEMGDPARDVDEFFFTRARIAGRREQIRLQVSAEMGVPIDPRDMWMPGPNEQPNGEVGAGETDGGESEDDNNPKPKDSSDEN